MVAQILFAIAVGFLLFSIARRRIRSRGLPFPPGPKPRPVIGNLLDIPREKAFLTYTKWGKEYGDVLFLYVPGTSTVILNSVEAVNDLLEKKGATYSDRPRFAMLNDLIGWNWNLVLMPYGRMFSVYRRIIQQQFQPNVVDQTYQPIIAEESRILLTNLKDDPKLFVQHLKRTAGAIIMKITYGHEVPFFGDEFVTLAEDVRAVGKVLGNPGTHIVDMFPILAYLPDWFPGASFKSQAQRWSKLADQMRERPYQVAKELVATGRAPPSMAGSLLEDPEVNMGGYDQDEVIMSTAGTVYSAGADTTASAMTNFLLAMQLYPEVQKKAQQELDAITGRKRLPDFTDRAALPYIDAIVKETLRWRPIAPLGVPHRVTEDDYYKGMFIPRGTTVLANIWGIFHDERVYNNPEGFVPERFLEKTPETDTEMDPVRVAFGFGRRICPGRHMADASLFIAIAYILSIYNITPAVDENGSEIVPQVEWSSGLVSLASPFDCNIKPRWEGALNLI